MQDKDIKFDGVKVIGAVKPFQCRKICRALSTCMGFDYDISKDKCYAYVTRNTKFALKYAPDMDHYRLDGRCSPGGTYLRSVPEVKLFLLS